MIEIYTDTAEQVELKLYLSGVRTNSTIPVTIQIVDIATGEVVVAETQSDVSIDPEGNETYFYVIPLALTKFDRTLRATWKFRVGTDDGTRQEIIEVVTPYVYPDEVLSAYSELEGKSYDEIKEVERLVRKIIDSVAGQSFGKKEMTINIAGTGSSSLSLPSRIIRLDSISVNGTAIDTAAYGIEVSDTGWVINRGSTGLYYDVKADISPWAVSTFFKDRATYTVVGEFGWESVPNEINLAAKLLVKDYFCKENLWRQKGVAEVKTGDWSFKFRSPTTGNEDADRLIENFANPAMVVI